MKKTFLIALSCFLCAVIIASCKKTSEPSTPYTPLYGTWKITQEAFDDNNTGKLDSNQLYNLPAGDVESILFNRDSSGTHFITFNNVKNDFNFNWILQNNFTVIRMITSGGDTIQSAILSLYGSRLTLANNTTPKASWYILEKQ